MLELKIEAGFQAAGKKIGGSVVDQSVWKVTELADFDGFAITLDFSILR